MTARKIQWMFGIMAAALAGCASAPSGVIPAEDGAYRVSVFGARYETQADTNRKALIAADDYCDKMAQHVMFRQSVETREHAWSAKQEDLTFVCMDAKNPAYMRAAVEHTPTVIAQQ